MGIVVTVFMLLILFMSIHNPLRTWLKKRQGAFSLWALLAGVWNFAWYGAQHLGFFWGNAAFISGLLMIVTSIPLLKADTWPTTLRQVLLSIQAYRSKLPRVFDYLALLALAVCAALYSYTLIKLNLR
jgi:hypothetical protein